jgi:hypothetical protein
MKPRWQDALRQGLIAGVIGFTVTNVLYALANTLQGRSPFHTAATLGAALIYGVRDPLQVAVTPAYVFAYNGLHLLVFVALGMVGAALARLADRGRQLWYVGLFFFIFVNFHMIAAVQTVALPMEPLLSGPGIWIAGIGAGVAMALYLLKAHPDIRSPQIW